MNRRRWLRRPEYLTPVKKAGRTFAVAVFDIETKQDESQVMGFDRPFLVVLRAANGDHWTFRDTVRRGPWQDWAIQPGGCIDKALEYIFSEPRFAANARSYTNRKGEKIKLPPTYLYGHNAGNFDMNHLIRWLMLRRNQRRFDVEIMPVQGSILQMTVYVCSEDSGKRRRSKWKYVFRDSAKLLPGKLDDVAKAFGVPAKLPMDLNTDENDDIWDEYCLQDCVATHAVVTAFAKEIDSMGGSLGVTLPSTAMRLFRSRYLKRAIKRQAHFPWCPDVCPKCERERCKGDCPGHGEQEEKRKSPPQCPTWPMGCHHAFAEGFHPMCGEHAGGHRHGGRTEVMITKCDKPVLKYFDRNSSYPASMCKAMPIRLAHAYDEDLSWQTLSELASMGLIGFVECIVEIPKSCKIPPLGIVREDKLVFPTGQFFGRFAWCELQHLTAPGVGGKLCKTFRSTWFIGEPIFEDMMRSFYDTRSRDKTSPRGNACKLIMNALYGKCAQNPIRDHCVTRVPGSLIPDNWRPTNPKCEDPKEWPIGYIEVYQEAGYFIPQIASWITALSREALWLEMHALVMAGHEVYMCDTDSIVTDGDMSSTNELGGWKREYEEHQLSGEFPLPKLYTLRSHNGPFKGHHKLDDKGNRLCALDCKGCEIEIVHMKGVPRHQHTPAAFSFFLAGGTLVSSKPPKFGTLARNGYTAYETKEHPKSKRSVYDKRIVLANHQTAPLRYSSDVVFDWDDGKKMTCAQLLRNGIP